MGEALSGCDHVLVIVSMHLQVTACRAPSIISVLAILPWSPFLTRVAMLSNQNSTASLYYDGVQDLHCIMYLTSPDAM